MNEPMIYDNIVEAIRFFNPNHALLNCLTRSGYARKTSLYTDVAMSDGTIARVKQSSMLCFFRGESRPYPSCKSTLYRIADPETRLVELLKTYHFRDYLQFTPEVQQFTLQNRYVDFWMLAQHYDFATPMLDVTDEIAVATFFATHTYDPVTRSYVLKTDGIGSIRYCERDALPPDALHLVGVQPFGRPSQQDGYALWLPESADFAEFSHTLQFHQIPEVNQKLARATFDGVDYFPPESIGVAARFIHESDLMTSAAIDALLEDQANGQHYLTAPVTREQIQSVLSKKGYHIVDAEIFDASHFVPDSGLMTERPFLQHPYYRPVG